MKKTRFSEEQMVTILREADTKSVGRFSAGTSAVTVTLPTSPPCRSIWTTARVTSAVRAMTCGMTSTPPPGSQWR